MKAFADCLTSEDLNNELCERVEAINEELRGLGVTLVVSWEIDDRIDQETTTELLYFNGLNTCIGLAYRALQRMTHASAESDH